MQYINRVKASREENMYHKKYDPVILHYVFWDILAIFVISRKKIPHVDPFQSFFAPYQPVLFRESHCHLSEQSFPLVEHSVHARAIFRGFAGSREKSRWVRGTRRWPIVHHISMLPFLACIAVVATNAENEKHAFFSLRARFKRILPRAAT